MGCPGATEVSVPTATRNTRVLTTCRIRTANILLVSIRALANEVAKNLVLAGIGSITLADHEVVTENDLGAQFFITEADVGKNVSRSLVYQHSQC